MPLSLVVTEVLVVAAALEVERAPRALPDGSADELAVDLSAVAFDDPDASPILLGALGVKAPLPETAPSLFKGSEA